MLSPRNTERLAGTLLVGAFVAFLAHFVVYGVGGMRLVVFCLLSYGFLTILSGIALYQVFRPRERMLALFGASGLAAHGVFVAVVCALFLTSLELSNDLIVSTAAEPDQAATQAVAAVAGSDSMSVAVAGRALSVTQDSFFGFAFMSLCFGLSALGALIVWSGAIARWIGWLAGVSGLLGFPLQLLGVFRIELFGLADILVRIGAMLAVACMLIVGVRLLLRQTRERAAGP